MIINNKQAGFSAVELLITLFIAAAFLITGYQLYGVVIKDGGEARAQAKAGNVAADYLQRYKASAANPCTVQIPLNTPNTPTIVIDGLSAVSIKVEISCPYSTATSVSKIQATLKYGNPQQTIVNATYVNK